MITRFTRPLLIAFGVGACLLAAGCSSSATGSTTSGTAGHPSVPSTTSAAVAGPTSSSAAPTPVAATSITIKNFGFTVSGPAKAGSTVKVTNNDAEAHTVTADTSGGFDVTIQPGKTATFTAPAAAGFYKFHCSFHSNMHGALTVTK